MISKKDLKRYQSNRQGELDSIYLYRALSRSEKNKQLSEIYSRLAESEEKHARFWENKIVEAGATLSRAKTTFRARTLGFLARRFGARFVLPTVVGLEQKDRGSYSRQPESKSTDLPKDEQSHSMVLRAMSQARGGLEGGTVAQLEGRHRAIGGNALRAAVLGANDGLVSNTSLIMGVAGASFSNTTILITGFAGLLAGASSMAMGEWLSVQSSRELYERQIGIEAEELREAPLEEQQELSLIYQAKGATKEEADRFAATLIRDEKNALDTLAREELGIDLESLGGSAWEAAATSFALFCAGALVPLVPFLLLSGRAALFTSIGVSAGALFLMGVFITLLTGRHPFFSGLRQLLIGLAAAGITFVVGRWVGIHLG